MAVGQTLRPRIPSNNLQQGIKEGLRRRLTEGRATAVEGKTSCTVNLPRRPLIAFCVELITIARKSSEKKAPKASGSKPGRVGAVKGAQAKKVGHSQEDPPVELNILQHTVIRRAEM